MQLREAALATQRIYSTHRERRRLQHLRQEAAAECGPAATSDSHVLRTGSMHAWELLQEQKLLHEHELGAICAFAVSFWAAQPWTAC